jgi:hypothetical protein
VTLSGTVRKTVGDAAASPVLREVAMDAQIAAPPDKEELAPHARLPGEPAEPSAEKGLGDCAAALEPGEALGPSSLAAPTGPPEADHQIGSGAGSRAARGTDAADGPESRRFRARLKRLARRWKRRHILLAGVAVLALGATTFLASPYNQIYPVPQMASTVRHWAAEAGFQPPEPLAPAASLAGVPVPPAEPVTREKYQPKKKDQQLQELLGFREPARAPGSAPGEGQPENETATRVPTARKAPVAPPVSAAASSSPPIGHDPAGRGRDEPPPGYVPSEPGSRPSLPPAASEPASAEAGGSPGRDVADGKAASRSARVPPVASGRNDATAAVVASLPKSVEATPSSPVAQPPAAIAAPAEVSRPFATPGADPVKTAGELHAAPMAPKDQVQVLELVTQVAAMLRDLRAQDAQLRADFGKAASDNATRIADFERRLALAEARHAVSAAQEAGELAPSTSASASPKPSSPAPTVPVQLTRAEIEVRGPNLGAVKRYRVQAASPGLALLAEVDRGGGDGAQRQVLVGDTIPGYGRIKAIGQRGTAWVVETEHGNIQ